MDELKLLRERMQQWTRYYEEHDKTDRLRMAIHDYMHQMTRRHYDLIPDSALCPLAPDAIDPPRLQFGVNCWDLEFHSRYEHKTEENMENIDLTEEIKDLLTVYTEKHRDTEENLPSITHNLIYHMRKFIASYEVKEECERKLDKLKKKLNIKE